MYDVVVPTKSYKYGVTYKIVLLMILDCGHRLLSQPRYSIMIHASRDRVT